MKRKLQNILVTGGAGFIGSNFISLLLKNKDFSGRVINLDKITYAGNLNNLSDLPRFNKENTYQFIQGDIQDRDLVRKIFKDYQIDTVVHFAAESHVDRSIENSTNFLTTNILGTHNLLNCALEFWENLDGCIFHHISTDEVFGELEGEGSFTENTPYNPRNPYSASKAASDHFVRAYHHTYGLPVIITNCSNNFGPRQHEEKFIPTIISAILKNQKIPLYGDGEQIRDWIYVDDHNDGVLQALKFGKSGNTYNLGARCEVKNIDLVKIICEKMAIRLGKSPQEFFDLIDFVQDRPGHDKRYAINPTKAETKLKWKAKTNFNEAITSTIDWYLDKKD